MHAAHPQPLELSDADRALIDGWLRTFERSWNTDQLDAQVNELPPLGNPLRAIVLIEMVKIDVHRQWRQGRQINLESYLERFPELGTGETVPVELIRTEYEARRRVGALASLTEFAKRFPHRTAELRRFTELDETAHPSLETPKPVSTSDAPPIKAAESLPEEFGRYRIIRKLGEGGMGAVYLAQDGRLDRLVALKVPNFKSAENPDILARFYREAQAAARLDHPSICPVHDVGETNGVHYLTMAYVEGSTLAQLLKEGHPRSQTWAAEMVCKLANALDEAHRRGVVHRDLKTSNIMINQRGEPVIMDFGLARWINKDEARLTKSGEVLGTPAYMSPEQVAGDVAVIGPACDIYSLGVIFYELLTGRLPYEGTVASVLARILTEEAAPVWTHRADLDPRLAVMCHKAMARKIGARYTTMSELAADLVGYLQNLPDANGQRPSADSRPKPVQARSRWYWVAAALVTMLAVGACLWLWFSWFRPTPSSPEAAFAKRPTQTLPEELPMPAKKTPPAGQSVVDGQSDPEPKNAILAVEILGLPTPEEEVAPARPEPSAVPDDRVGELRRFEGHTDVIWAVAFSPDGRQILSGSEDQSMRLWDAVSGAEVRHFAGHTGALFSVAFSPDGRRVLSGGDDRTARLWDVATGKELIRFGADSGVVARAIFSPDGRHILSAGADQLLRLWDATTGREVRVFAGHTDWVRGLAFSADGSLVASAGDDHTVRLWDVDGGKEVQRFAGHTNWVSSVAFAPDRWCIVSGSRDKTARLWDAENGKELHRFEKDSGPVYHVAISPDGRRLLTASGDKSVRLWDLKTGAELHRFDGHTGSAYCVAFSPDGRRAVSGSGDKTVTLWGLPK